MTNVITHRGLDPSKAPYFLESSIEAFQDQLQRGYGIEFDIQRTIDDEFVVIHDTDLRRISGGQDTRKISEITLQEIENLEFNGCHLSSLQTLLQTINNIQNVQALSALHLKKSAQDKVSLELLAEILTSVDTSRFIVFDVTVATAEFLRKRLPGLRLAASVSDPFDIERYGDKTGGTLLSLKEVQINRHLFDGVVLDEWDTLSKIAGKSKHLYTKETFLSLRESCFFIVIISPELHGTSPGLLGGERHEDARNHQALIARIREIIELNPDGICTDYPDEVRLLL